MTFAMRLLFAAVLAVLLPATAAHADPYPVGTGSCTYDPATSTVTAVGLPTVLPHAVYGTTDAVVNFVREDAAGHWLDAYVIGVTDGTVTVTVPVPVDVETYEFVSQMWGSSDNSQYDVYAECSSA